jgi:hypothetical protein
MRNHALSQTPATTYTLPPSPPPAVAAAYETFARISADYATAHAELRQLTASAKGRIQAAIEAAATAAIDGGKAADPAKVQTEVTLQEIALKTKVSTLEKAVDQAGDRLAEAVGANRSEWSEALSVEAAEAAAAYTAALQAAEEELARFAPVARAQEWLATFDVGRAKLGEVTQFSGGRVRIRLARDERRFSLNDDGYDPYALLSVAAKAVAS